MMTARFRISAPFFAKSILFLIILHIYIIVCLQVAVGSVIANSLLQSSVGLESFPFAVEAIESNKSSCYLPASLMIA